jgi:two-component system chemotaxis response regulator CheY
LPRTVLIVDDSPTIRGFAKIFLRPLQVEIAEAEEGQQALDLVRANPPALAIVDINMPGMDGLTLLRELRADPRPEISGMPVVLLTGDRSEQIREKGLQAGANDFIGKPIKGPELQAVVKKLLGAGP